MSSATERLIERPGLRLIHWPAWIPPDEAEALERQLGAEVPWKQEAITLFGRCHPLPRLTCWMGDPGCGYRYSGLENVLEPWSPAAEQLRRQLQALTGWRFNSLLLNRYRDGCDAMGWHADDEPELDPAAPIASLSLGASRDFRLRPRPSPRRPPGLREPEGYSINPGTKSGPNPGTGATCTSTGSCCAPFNLKLAHGDLLLMEPPSQWWWQHAVPRRQRVQQERLNLTFRVVRPSPPAG
ncbi:alpha-ketoglutarate-dependent dioxygenase AlkB [Cyanobium sp. CH-040]|uniref:alpha-ketoglutarate-dependent dioxygenase AlkB family protein n=1 Tax=Cyanobium sp. CH-040 TaxID=2823708 RepID=UPI0020CC2D41|nr:alpha-ketoglutarate-dependent dioxygenase AlkB [Cyanobium sp. CH-040]MCP9926723.1 alpha-ketoglutarate-dependent dioxygenase AlkB [Cyanobium sp. CH-040]